MESVAFAEHGTFSGITITLQTSSGLPNLWPSSYAMHGVQMLCLWQPEEGTLKAQQNWSPDPASSYYFSCWQRANSRSFYSQEPSSWGQRDDSREQSAQDLAQGDAEMQMWKLQPETNNEARKARKDWSLFLLTCSCTETQPDYRNSLTVDFIASVLFMVSITSISRAHQFNRTHWHFLSTSCSVDPIVRPWIANVIKNLCFSQTHLAISISLHLSTGNSFS